MEKDTSLRTRGDKVMQVICYVVLIAVSLSIIFPFLLLVSSSLTDNDALRKYGYNIFPSVFSTYAYEYLLVGEGAKILRSFGLTAFVTVVGTTLSLLIGPMLGYALSRKDYPRRKTVTFLVVFTMLFNGGVVPSYIMWTQIFNIKNTVWALIFPNMLLNAFSVILYKNYFATNIHPSLIEAAKLDGAGEF